MSFSKASDEGDMLANHPTPKPVRMIADAILDCTKRGEIILEMFCGSGTAIIAAERTGRACYAIELDPVYVDLAIRRWQQWTGENAIHEQSGTPFNELAGSRTAQTAEV
ncbi:MAG: DNA methyltransferase [Sphingorhabdus sp.]